MWLVGVEPCMWAFAERLHVQSRLGPSVTDKYTPDLALVCCQLLLGDRGHDGTRPMSSMCIAACAWTDDGYLLLGSKGAAARFLGGLGEPLAVVSC